MALRILTVLSMVTHPEPKFGFGLRRRGLHTYIAHVLPPCPRACLAATTAASSPVHQFQLYATFNGLR
jgi:hypothetical protein